MSKKIVSVIVSILVVATVFCGCKARSTGNASKTSCIGTYAHSYTEELEGKPINFEEFIILNEDHTCLVAFQDMICGTWSEDEICLDDGSKFEISMGEKELKLNRDGIWVEFYM